MTNMYFGCQYEHPPHVLMASSLTDVVIFTFLKHLRESLQHQVFLIIYECRLRYTNRLRHTERYGHIDGCMDRHVVVLMVFLPSHIPAYMYDIRSPHVKLTYYT